MKPLLKTPPRSPSALSLLGPGSELTVHTTSPLVGTSVTPDKTEIKQKEDRESSVEFCWYLVVVVVVVGSYHWVNFGSVALKYCVDY